MGLLNGELHLCTARKDIKMIQFICPHCQMATPAGDSVICDVCASKQEKTISQMEQIKKIISKYQSLFHLNNEQVGFRWLSDMAEEICDNITEAQTKSVNNDYEITLQVIDKYSASTSILTGIPMLKSWLDIQIQQNKIVHNREEREREFKNIP
jgi:hypothetical protein